MMRAVKSVRLVKRSNKWPYLAHRREGLDCGHVFIGTGRQAKRRDCKVCNGLISAGLMRFVSDVLRRYAVTPFPSGGFSYHNFSGPFTPQHLAMLTIPGADRPAFQPGTGSGSTR